MRRLIVSLLLILGALTASGQYSKQSSDLSDNLQYYAPNPFHVQTLNITTNVVANGWAMIGNTCAGCAGYYYRITKTSQPHHAKDDNTYYYYYIWFFSNSYYSNGAEASTYLTGVVAYINGREMITLPYALVTRMENYFVWLRTSDPYAIITFTVNKMSVY